MNLVDDLSSAIIAYLGYGVASHPQSDWLAVVEAIGMDRANAVEIPMLGLLGELRCLQPDWQQHSLYSGSEWVVRKVRAHHIISDQAAKALIWLYSYENK